MSDENFQHEALRHDKSGSETEASVVERCTHALGGCFRRMFRREVRLYRLQSSKFTQLCTKLGRDITWIFRSVPGNNKVRKNSFAKFLENLEAKFCYESVTPRSYR